MKTEKEIYQEMERLKTMIHALESSINPNNESTQKALVKNRYKLQALMWVCRAFD